MASSAYTLFALLRGANANSVKELVLCSLFLASRGIVQVPDDNERHDDSEDVIFVLLSCLTREADRFQTIRLILKRCCAR